MSAHELVGEALSEAASEARKEGRLLILKFIGGDHPELDRIQFRWSEKSQTTYWQQGDPENPLYWREVSQALALVFLDYLAAGKQTTGPVFFCGERTGSLASSLGDAINQPEGKLNELFVEWLRPAAPVARVKKIFSGKNVHGKDKENPERRIFVRPDCLPLDCIELYWSAQGTERITNLAVARLLAERIRKSLGIEIPPPPPPRGEGSSAKAAAPVPVAKQLPLPVDPTPQAKPTTPAEPPSPPVEEKTPAKTGPVAGNASPKPEPEKPKTPVSGPTPSPAQKPAAAPIPSPVSPETPKKEPVPEPQQPAAKEPTTGPGQTPHDSPPEIEFKQKPRSRPPSPPIPPIAPEYFGIYNPHGLVWEDDMGLLDFGDDDSGEDIWKLRDACEGVLILGAPGSGKTSGSGFAFAGAFLSAGFGGLVLAAKPGEAQRWQKLCAQFGRAEDCFVVTPDSPHKLNILAYETQRPGNRLAVTEDLIAFFRVLISIVSKRTADSGKDDFWTNATNQLMRELFDIFLLAEEPLTIDSLTRFVTKAPEEPTPNWPNIPFFGEIILRAEAKEKSAEDERIFERVREYWTEVYPNIAHQTRSGIVLGFTAMANALSGRGIHNLISSETTVTPELIMSGAILVLDLPLKECGQGGLLIQAAWKYLFQRAIERRADKGKPTARPVFLWEDEGHLFFSQHDIEFQPTARDCRAAHVIISQSLHNFYQLGHNPHAVQGVFATMNTHIFHANGDLDTNKWASERIGTTMRSQVSVSISSHPKPPRQTGHWLLDMFNHGEQQESNASTSVQQHRERLLEPETFAQLKKGGDGTCQAVILWMSHQFRCNQGRPFRVTTFEQSSNQ